MRTDGPYKTALSSVFLPARRSYLHAQLPTQMPTAMLFSSRPYSPPTSRTLQAAQHIKAFCGRSLPIGVRSGAQRDVSGLTDLLKHFENPISGPATSRTYARYSNLAIVALNARGLSVSGPLSSAAPSCQLTSRFCFPNQRTHTVNSLSWSPPAGAARPLLATLLSSPGGSFHTWNPQTQAVDTIRPACHLPASGYDAMLTAISWRSGGSEVRHSSFSGAADSRLRR